MKTVVVVILCIAAADAASAFSVTSGAMGDSFTDEWSLRDPAGVTKDVLNWVEILARSRRVDFGPVLAFPPSDIRHGTTATGKSHEYNFALAGATTQTLLGSGAPDYLGSQTGSPTQPDRWGGFLSYARSGVIEYGYLGIGINNVINTAFAAVSGSVIGPGPLALGPADPVGNPEGWGVLRVTFDGIWEAFSVVTSGAGNEVKMIVGNVPDLSTIEYLARWKHFRGITQDHMDNVRGNIALLNSWILTEATGRGVPVLDLWDWWEDARILGVTVGGVGVDVETSAPFTTDLTELDHFFLSDGLHPTPIAHGLAANRFLAVLRDAYGGEVELLSEAELLRVTGLRPIPELSAMGLVGIACVLLRRRRRAKP